MSWSAYLVPVPTPHPRRPAPPVALRLCAICGDRPADAVDLIEGYTGIERERPVCAECLAEAAEPDHRTGSGDESGHVTRDEVLRVVRRRREADTSTIREVVDAVTPRQQNALSAALRRLVESGALTSRDVIPGSPTRGKVYRATGRDPSVVGTTNGLAGQIAERIVGPMTGVAIANAMGWRDARRVATLVRVGMIERCGVNDNRAPLWRRTVTGATP